MHLIVLQHGVWGNPSNVKYLSKLLIERFGNKGFVLNFSGNLKFATYDGIDICGERLFQGVKSTHDNLVHQGTPPTHISFIGYSMGGLITRYAAGRLFSEGYFDQVTPLNFITIATPHLGSWRQPKGATTRLVNVVTSAALSRTGVQLCLGDLTPWGVPLLCVLSHPGLNFMAAMRGFKNIVAMANVRYDRMVTFCSAAMQLEDPYPPHGFERAVALVDPAYMSIVYPLRHEDGPADPSLVGRPLHGRFLLVVLALLAVILFPLVLLMAVLLLLHGRLHSRRPETTAGDAVLENLYASWSGSGSAAADKQRPSLQGREVAQGRPPAFDLESGLQLRAVASGTAGGYGGSGGLVTSNFVGANAGARGGPEDRVPLHTDHLRQQQLFGDLPHVTDKRGLQEWLVAQLATLPVRKVHVDTCNVFHAHSAIVVWNRLFLHCRDAMQYLVDQCMVQPEDARRTTSKESD
ncbi:hypothetical protein VaNZ11_003715 [Volvox africanus]|uniref:DUF676 domain-containing protein n=1 Tax=Volvox africanus TaxID=51714 RepID=A0ABQ5RUQ5_9CHLO|nr:hypothetical protein VaNZ11_003715 [Volvox africanus]